MHFFFIRKKTHCYLMTHSFANVLYLSFLHARELFMILFSSADFLQNYVFTNKPPGTATIGVSNSLDPDQDQHSFALHLGSNCLQEAIIPSKVFISFIERSVLYYLRYM